jgi:glycosyltransferase involved in cell wall biosynthesis
VPGLSRDTVVYSPGYNALLRVRNQVLTLHDLIHLQTNWPGRAKYLAYYNGPVRRVVRRTGVVLTDSEASVASIRDWLRDDSVEVVNAGVGCSAEFSPVGPTYSTNRQYLVYVGNLRAHKNLDVVLQALRLVPDLTLYAVVPESEASEAAQRINAVSLSGRVKLLHNLQDAQVAGLYRGAVATVMPSLLEGFGLPPLESVCCGTPVVFWRGCEPVAETVDDRGYGVDSAHDPEEWASAILAALHENRRVEPPEPGAYSWDRTAAVVSEILRKALVNVG